MPGHFKWVVDQENPQGRAVPLTPAEEAQFDADQIAGATAASAADTRNANVSTIQTSISGRLTKIRQARNALAAGNIFAALSVNEKAVIDGLLEDNLYLARLTLNLYDGTA